jgi:hypothetical protein
MTSKSSEKKPAGNDLSRELAEAFVNPKQPTTNPWRDIQLRELDRQEARARRILQIQHGVQTA